MPRLNAAQRERAMLADPKEFPQEMPCAVCGFRWMQHKGRLCPARPGYLDPLTHQAIPPAMGDTEFIPDADFYKEADFDVI